MHHSTVTKHTGLDYFFKGLQLISLPGIRPFVLIPLLINLVLFSLSFAYLLSRFSDWIDWGSSYLPDWLSWVAWLIWPILLVSLLFGFGFSFSIVANWIAAPFNGLLAEKIEQRLLNLPETSTSIGTLIADLPRIFYREWQKLLYWLPKALGLALLFLVPVLGQTIAPLCWLLFSAWMMSIQYADYPFDNHKVPFHTMRDELKQARLRNLGFGGMVMLCSSIPLVNLLVMPVAVAGATAMWVECSRDKLTQQANSSQASAPSISNDK